MWYAQLHWPLRQLFSAEICLCWQTNQSKKACHAQGERRWESSNPVGRKNIQLTGKDNYITKTINKRLLSFRKGMYTYACTCIYVQVHTKLHSTSSTVSSNTSHILSKQEHILQLCTAPHAVKHACMYTYKCTCGLEDTGMFPIGSAEPVMPNLPEAPPCWPQITESLKNWTKYECSTRKSYTLSTRPP